MARAATYIRMSTEHQRYSPEQQRLLLEEYAGQHGHEIVRRYSDEGVSGLRLETRPGLRQLLADVLSGEAPYSVILVYDVSRWGRFQDPDQGAHYEFMCRQAGVGVEYCAEPFDNDGSLTSTIVKQLKRAMAAEYSRELSAKVVRAQSELAALGFWQGGPPGYALRRRLVKPDGSLGPLLAPGEGKPREGRVVLDAGPPEEVETVQRIFRLFVVGGMSRRTVARRLNEDGIAAEGGALWTSTRVAQVLTNEKYLGIQVFGKTAHRLGARVRRIDRKSWARTPAGYEAMVTRTLFDQAQRNMAKRFRRAGRDDMIEGLRALLRREGRLNSRLIREAEELPCPEVYRRRFGGLLEAYARVGFAPSGRAEAAARASPRGSQVGKVRRASNHLTDEEILVGMRALYEEHGRLTAWLIDQAPSLPSTDLILKRFGSLLGLYRLVGYAPDAKQRAASLWAKQRRPISHPG